ncbi:MAG: hypothetical protein ACK47Z_17085 [Paracoccaceae bacterium]|jgi:integrase/recombinase XerD
MLKSHDDLIAELSNSLTELNYNPVCVDNHRLYARAFLGYLNERGVSVAEVTPTQVDQYFSYAVQCFHVRYGRPPSSRWHRLPHTAICKLLRLGQGKWPPESETTDPAAALRRAICQEYEAWMRDERGLAKATIDARLREARRFLDWYFGRCAGDGLLALGVRDIDLYMDMRAHGLRRISLAGAAVWLRCLLGYLHRTRRVRIDLTSRVIGPMLYAYENVPSILARSHMWTPPSSSLSSKCVESGWVLAYVRPRSAAGWPRALMISADHGPYQIIALLGAVSRTGFPDPRQNR